MEKSCREALGLVAKMFAACLRLLCARCSLILFSCICSLNIVHDDLKDKPMELELGWVCAESGWKYQAVPKSLL